MVVRWRRGRELRRPTDAQLDDIAQPLARVAMRHVPAELLSADLADLTLAGAAVGAYLNAGPLIVRQAVDAGVPADINRSPEDSA